MLTTTIELVGCDETPPEYANRIGEKYPIPSVAAMPAPGWRGRLFDVPGVLLDYTRFEIRPVDMRTQETKWLDEADALLSQLPQPDEAPADTAYRYARAQRLILLAQSRVTRRAVNTWT